MQLGWKLTPKVTAQFFDRPAIRLAVGKAEYKVLRIMGYRIRQSARKSIKVKPYLSAKTKKRNLSPAGRPPIAHDRDGIRLIYYTFDRNTRSMVAGPIPFGRKAGGKTVPQLHEFGGTVLTRRRERATYPARPFMNPAYQKHLPELPSLWKDAIK